MRERADRGPGFHRRRPEPAAPIVFEAGGHAFETDGKDLWVTPPGAERIDRFKVSRYVSSKSMRHGYPRELVRPEPVTEAWARAAAAFWLDWSMTPEAAAHPPVYLGHYVRQLEARELASA